MASNELVMDDKEPPVGGAWRAQQSRLSCRTVIVGAASPDAADAGRLGPSAAGGHGCAEIEGETGTWKSRFVSRKPAHSGYKLLMPLIN